MALGLRNAPAAFSRLVAKVFEGLEQFCEAYIDDVLVFSVSWSQHIDHRNQVFNRIKLANLKLNVAKYQFATRFSWRYVKLEHDSAPSTESLCLVKLSSAKDEKTG